MISKSKLRNYFLKKCDNITDSLTRFCESGDHEEIHKLRIEFKKLRALVSLVEECNTNSFIPREFRTAKVVYKRAGVVRDAFIAHQQNISVSQSGSAGAKEFLELAAREFCNKKDLHLLVMKDWLELTKEQFENISNNCAISYYKKWLGRLSENFISVEEEELHQCRKIIKRLMYLYPLMTERISQSIRVNISYLDTLQEEIGKWHDTLIAREHYSGSVQKNEKHLCKIVLSGEARLRSIRLLAKNFDEKFEG